LFGTVPPPSILKGKAPFFVFSITLAETAFGYGGCARPLRSESRLLGGHSHPSVCKECVPPSPVFPRADVVESVFLPPTEVWVWTFHGASFPTRRKTKRSIIIPPDFFFFRSGDLSNALKKSGGVPLPPVLRGPPFFCAAAAVGFEYGSKGARDGFPS